MTERRQAHDDASRASTSTTRTNSPVLSALRRQPAEAGRAPAALKSLVGGASGGSAGSGGIVLFTSPLRPPQAMASRQRLARAVPGLCARPNWCTNPTCSWANRLPLRTNRAFFVLRRRARCVPTSSPLRCAAPHAAQARRRPCSPMLSDPAVEWYCRPQLALQLAEALSRSNAMMRAPRRSLCCINFAAWTAAVRDTLQSRCAGDRDWRSSRAFPGSALRRGDSGSVRSPATNRRSRRMSVRF